MMMDQLKVYNITNHRGWTGQILNYGATLNALFISDAKGIQRSVVLGFENPMVYGSAVHQNAQFFVGATVGRFAGRIGSGGFRLNDQDHPISANERGIQLHGGPRALNTLYWTAPANHSPSDASIELSVLSPEGHNGFPGNLKITARFEWLDETFRVTYTACSDQDTIVNLTNHSYFNLDGSGSVCGHELYINANKRLALNDDLLPTGHYCSLEGTSFDFSQSKPICQKSFGGLDTPFVLNKRGPHAILYSQKSGIKLSVTTNQPGLVVFTPHNFSHLTQEFMTPHEPWPGLCLECQNFPDAPHHPHFPTSVLKANEVYNHITDYDFSIDGFGQKG